jgi:diguanylate cyclase (GGDEF)-like protein
VTVSLGVSLFPKHGASGEELMRAADTALYASKRGGRDRSTIAD